MKEKICLNQLIRPKIYVPKEGIGNCVVCKTDEDNKNCKGYMEINLCIVEVK